MECEPSCVCVISAIPSLPPCLSLSLPPCLPSLPHSPPPSLPAQPDRVVNLGEHVLQIQVVQDPAGFSQLLVLGKAQVVLDPAVSSKD